MGIGSRYLLKSIGGDTIGVNRAEVIYLAYEKMECVEPEHLPAKTVGPARGQAHRSGC